MTGQPEHVLVVGAGLGGVRTAEQLRAAGFQGRISLIGAEPHLPYDRPPLSKQVLAGEWEPGRTILRTLDQLADLGVRAHLGLPAVALRTGDTAGSAGSSAGVSAEVELADGSTLYGDAVVIATGLVARRLPDQPAHVPTLRTLEDSLALRAELDRIDSLLIVGAGFIGAEVATAARVRGIAVTVVEAADNPAQAALGPVVSRLCARLFVEAGVDLRLGTTLLGFADAGARVAVDLAGGGRLEADAGLVGNGTATRLDWLGDGNGPPAPGLFCSATGRVRDRDATWAVGDVAIWDDGSGARHRSEHWSNAVDQAAVVARDILGAPPPPPTVPYFWSDQFGLKIQLFGRTDTADAVLPLHGSGLSGGPVRGTVAGYLAGDRLIGAVAFGSPRLAVRYRALIAAGASRADAQATAALG